MILWWRSHGEATGREVQYLRTLVFLKALRKTVNGKFTDKLGLFVTF